ncbi:transglycosylase SLT domain-containing protein [Halobacillus shinanisalinarum]|uniref:Transglycosylase SLT domain-containing protein n=1 Tax=Halobacillus shinanisalinarum TaxID=2932258 RepID=A0ABY4H1G6_9BACI|nr:transglycosylase SLT domain-containing protein [Halobacillus shinanisalinarum]UOQ93755.1 transglycosylase SLT domain-containing protein [Halobacillus shinanisalinarum]
MSKIKGLVIFIQVGISIILVVGTYLIMNYYKEQETLALVEKNKRLTEKNEQLQAKSDYLLTETEGSKKTKEFKTWSKHTKLANVFYEDSDQEFKKSWALYLIKQSAQYGVDPYVVYELLKVETGGTFDPKLVGPDTEYGKAYGMAQFMKNTAPWIAEMAGLPYKDELLFDPYYSMQLSVVYLDYLHNKYDNWDKALTAYHRGVGGLNDYIEENGHAESWYAKEIQSKAEAYETIALAN